MLKNMKVKESLILGFGITIIVSVAIIIASLMMTNSLSKGYQNIINIQVRANELVRQSRVDTNLAARNVREAVMVDTINAAPLQSKAEESMQQLSRDLATLKEIYPNDNLVTNYINASNEWQTEAKLILSLNSAGRREEAVTHIVEVCSPKLAELAAVAEELDTVLTVAKNDAIAKQERMVLLSIVLIAVVMVIATIIVVIIAIKLIKGIVEPTTQVRNALVGFSEGRLNIPVDYESKNELGDMCAALRTSQHVLTEVISDECRILEEMAKGNFDVNTKDESIYVGALSSVYQSIQTISQNLSDALSQIEQSADQVASGADQVSTGAQALAQGATEQASAVEELSATIAEISHNSQNNARNSEEAMKHSQDAGQQLTESSKYMQEMVQAMEKISDSSEEIGKIIATIENIAFQTNILALNAAVEAARAGSAGKGFAVVADEVRNLASKSDQAAKATKDLIERSINAVKEGNEIVKSVSDSLDKTVESASLVVESVQMITKAAEEESEAITQVTEGIDQISSVVQTNSATSEQSAAASEELSSQAALMKDLMARFKLRGSDGGHARSSQSVYRAASSFGAEDYDDGREAAGAGAFSKY